MCMFAVLTIRSSQRGTGLTTSVLSAFCSHVSVCVYGSRAGLAKQQKCFKGQAVFQCQNCVRRGSMRAREKRNEREREKERVTSSQLSVG